MKKIVLAIIFMMVFVIPTSASASKDKGQTVCGHAYNLRMKVIKMHGKRAPGRNICRFGVKLSNGKVLHATRGQKSRYSNALYSLTTPPQYNTLVRTAVLPKNPPAGTLSPSVGTPAGGTLAKIRACESGGNYSTDTGNGFRGAYQFTDSTWASVGGSGNAANASPHEQDIRAAALYAREGASPWPVCGR